MGLFAKGDRVRLSQDGLRHFKYHGGKSPWPWHGIVASTPQHNGLVRVILNGLRPSSAQTFYAGYWRQTEPDELGSPTVIYGELAAPPSECMW